MALVVGTNCGLVTTAPTDDPQANSVVTDNWASAIKVTTTDAGTITEVGWWCDTASEAANFEVGIYSHDAVNNRPDALLEVSRTNAKGTTAGWKKKTGLSWSLNASTIYWIAYQLDNTATQTDSNFGAIIGERYSRWNLQTTLPASWTSTAYSDNFLAIYAVWEAEAAEGTNIQINVGDAWKEVSAMKVNVGDAWEAVTSTKVNVGDAWKTVF